MAFTIDLKAGVDYDITLFWKDADGKPIDVRTFQAFMQIREKVDSAEVFFDASPFLITNGDGAESGAVRLNIPASETQSLPPLLRGVFDIKLKSATGNVYLLIDGIAKVTRTVTVVP